MLHIWSQNSAYPNILHFKQKQYLIHPLDQTNQNKLYKWTVQMYLFSTKALPCIKSVKPQNIASVAPIFFSVNNFRPWSVPAPAAASLKAMCPFPNEVFVLYCFV